MKGLGELMRVRIAGTLIGMAALALLTAGAAGATESVGLPDVVIDAGDEPAAGEIGSPEEMVLFTKEERAEVATKRAVAVSEAPANVVVITHEDILRSPALSIPEILRRVAGVDVITVTAAESDMSVRGFATTLFDGDRIAVLIDGRDVNLSPIGGTIFSALPISRYDIKRIEVVKGPLSSLYGDRALLGTINIVTFDPDETRTVIAGGGGMQKTGGGDFINAGKFTDGLWYKITGTFVRTDEFEDIRGDGFKKDLQNFGATGMIEWKPSDATRLRLSGGVSSADLALQFVGISHWSMRDGYAMLDASHDFGAPGMTSGKFWWRGQRVSSSDVFNVGLPPDLLDSLSGEIRHTVDVPITDWLRNVAMVGFEYRLVSTSYQGSSNLHTISGFIQDELRFWEKVLVTGGFRFDYQKDFTGLNTSAHGAVVWLAHPKYTTRVSVSTAFNTPTFFNLFLNIPNIPYLGSTINAQGNRTLGSERIFYTEWGNEWRPIDRLAVRGDLFYYRMNNIISPALIMTAPADFIFTYDNGGGAEAIGGEIGIEARPLTGLELYANWAYEQMKPRAGNPYTTPNLGNPRNKVNAGARFVSDFGLFFDLDFHWVQSQWKQAGALANFPTTPALNLGELFLLNARVGYQPVKDHLELAIIANNILNDNTPQIPASDPILNVRMAERPTFRLLGTLSYTF